MRCIKKGANIHISTSSSSCDVGRHNHPLFGSNVPTRPSWGCARFPHLRLYNDFDIICYNPSPTTQYCPFFAPPNQTFQELTRPDTILTELRFNCKVLIGSMVITTLKYIVSRVVQIYI